MIDTVKGIEGVLEDKPINALVQELGDGAVRFRVRWWINSYADKPTIIDLANTAMFHAFKSAGIKLASKSYDLNVNLKSESMHKSIQTEQRD